MKRRYLLTIMATLLFAGATYTTTSIANAKKDTDIIEMVEDSSVTAAPTEDMLFDSTINLISSNSATVGITLLQGNSSLDKCSIVLSITFDDKECPCEIISPSGKHYTNSTVDAYNKEELTGFGIIAYYRIENIELGTYTIISSTDANIFNVSVDMGMTDKTEFMIDESGAVDESMTGNVMTQSEYDAFVEDTIENESVTEDESDENVVTQGGMNLEGQTGDIDGSLENESLDSIEEYNEKLEDELKKYSE